ncbi:MAG: glycerol kinase GlpK [Candidatus Latescibacteria bacterium]|nr:glycerol kinase GlpK [Candidatus Latescibacterota bacterium]
MPYVLAMDQGTSSSRALLVDGAGTVVATAQQPLTQHYPQPGWVEHDPEEIWEGQGYAVRQVLAAAGVGIGEVKALGIANQRETVVLWDRATGKPLHPALVWQDRRTAPQCVRLREQGHEEEVRAKTGLLLDPYFSSTKIAWLLDQVPGARQRAERGELAVGTVDSWLVWKLSGEHLTDLSNASRTLLLDLRRACWDQELLDLFGIPAALLPRIVPSSGVVARTRPEHLGGSLPIAGIAGDQQAALFGQQCTRPGMAKNTYGTGCFLLRHTGALPVFSRHRLLTTVAWQLQGRPPEYALEGSVFVAGAAVQWLRDGLGIIESAAQVNELAATVADSGGVVMVPAFTGLGAPHWDPEARGAIFGLTRGTTAGHLARATLEGIALQVADLLAAMEADAGEPLRALRVDGGAAASELLMQLQADLLGVPVERPMQTETTALGAAYLAGLGVGFWPDQAALAGQWRLERRFTPAMAQDTRTALKERWQRALARSRGWGG